MKPPTFPNQFARTAFDAADKDQPVGPSASYFNRPIRRLNFAAKSVPVPARLRPFSPRKTPNPTAKRRLKLVDLRAEPFRLFFPAAVLVGILGVALWPLYFGGFLENYPGASHTRLMGQGFFGGFIIGFLGTAMPRMLSTRPLPTILIGWLLAAFGVFASANFLGHTTVGDAAFLVVLLSLGVGLGIRFLQRRDVPPPGFVLVALAFACGLVGTGIGLISASVELSPTWLVLRPLLACQGFVLLPVLGVGGFILPRFLGLPNRHDLAESRNAPPGWWTKAVFALATGIVIIASFILEIEGWYRLAYTVRFLAAAGYLLKEVPVHRSGWSGGAVAWALRGGLAMILLGLLLVATFPTYRVALLHVCLVGGLGVVTIVVATRVIFGHSGNGRLLSGPNRWFWWAFGLILLGMATRVSGDFLPRIMISHYNYGALCWAAGMGIWAWKVLPKVLVPDDDD